MDLTAGGATVLRAAGPTASGTVTVIAEDARTNTVDAPFIVQSTTTGAPAADIGTGIQFNAESADENPSVFGRLDFAASDITAASEDTYLDILLRVAGVAEETKYRFASTAGTGFRGTFTHAATANRTWTLPDETGTIVTSVTAATLTGTQTLTNKTLTTPVISGAAPATPVANTLYTDSVVKAWLQTSGAGAPVIDDDLNVSSITDNGVGDFTLNWATAFANTTYTLMGIPRSTAVGGLLLTENPTGKAVGSCRLLTLNSGNGLAQDPAVGFTLIAIGDQ